MILERNTHKTATGSGVVVHCMVWGHTCECFTSCVLVFHQNYAPHFSEA